MIDRSPFVYLITSETGKMYIGSRTAKGCSPSDMGTTYFTSSVELKPQFKAHPELFSVLVRRFSTITACLECEIILHEKYDVGANQNFYNKAKQTSTGFNTAGTILSEEQRELRGRPITDENKKATAIRTRNHFKSLDNRKIHSASIKAAFTRPEVISNHILGNFNAKFNKNKVLEVGAYHVPLGHYIFLRHSVLIKGNYTMSHSNVRNWCKHPMVTISSQSARLNKFLTDADVGKTRKELGFYMVFPRNITKAQELIESSLHFINPEV